MFSERLHSLCIFFSQFGNDNVSVGVISERLHSEVRTSTSLLGPSERQMRSQHVVIWIVQKHSQYKHSEQSHRSPKQFRLLSFSRVSGSDPSLRNRLLQDHKWSRSPKTKSAHPSHSWAVGQALGQVQRFPLAQSCDKTLFKKKKETKKFAAPRCCGAQ